MPELVEHYPDLNGRTLLLNEARGILRESPDITATDLIAALSDHLDAIGEALAEEEGARPVGACRHCGRGVVVVDGLPWHSRPNGARGQRGCIANLAYTDPELYRRDGGGIRRRYAELA